MTDTEIFKMVLTASSVKGVVDLMSCLPIVSDEEFSLDHKGNVIGNWKDGYLHWLPVGLERGNGGRIKLAGNPMNPIAERVVNAKEAVIELERLKELLTDPNMECPISPRDAVSRYFGLPRLDEIAAMSNSDDQRTLLEKVKQIRGLVQVWLTRTEGKKSFSIMIKDQGIGQSPENIHQTLLSLGQTDKACLLYTSDAADDLLCVDLGGRRFI